MPASNHSHEVHGIVQNVETGVITSTSTDNRQLQFGVRVAF